MFVRKIQNFLKCEKFGKILENLLKSKFFVILENFFDKFERNS